MEHLNGPPVGLALALPSNSKTSLERVSLGKPSSLLGLIVSDEGKKFYYIDTRCKGIFFTVYYITLNSNCEAQRACKNLKTIVED
jgi:hypothetical protein